MPRTHRSASGPLFVLCTGLVVLGGAKHDQSGTQNILDYLLRAQSVKPATTAMGAHKKFLVSLTKLGVAQQKEPGVLLRKRSRLTQEAHIYFFQQAVSLFSITDLARSHQVFPRTRSATGARDNMVECQIAAAFTAILARFVVA